MKKSPGKDLVDAVDLLQLAGKDLSETIALTLTPSEEVPGIFEEKDVNGITRTEVEEQLRTRIESLVNSVVETATDLAGTLGLDLSKNPVGSDLAEFVIKKVKLELGWRFINYVESLIDKSDLVLVGEVPPDSLIIEMKNDDVEISFFSNDNTNQRSLTVTLPKLGILFSPTEAESSKSEFFLGNDDARAVFFENLKKKMLTRHEDKTAAPEKLFRNFVDSQKRADGSCGHWEIAHDFLGGGTSETLGGLSMQEFRVLMRERLGGCGFIEYKTSGDQISDLKIGAETPKKYKKEDITAFLQVLREIFRSPRKFN